MSDTDDFTDNESELDFSASEEEWKPNKDDVISTDEEDIVDDDSQTEDTNDEKKSQPQKLKSKRLRKIIKNPKLTGSKKQTTASLRSKLFSKYKSPGSTTNKLPVPPKVTEILSQAEFKQRKQMPSTSKAPQPSDSDSSNEDGLIRPSQIDYKSNFFSTNKSEEKSTAPSFDCNAGINLSDSSDDEQTLNESDASNEQQPKPNIIEQINKQSSHEMYDFSNIMDFASNLESTKKHMERLKQKELAEQNVIKTDVTKLLSMGETSIKSKLKHKAADDLNSDDSDWENVPNAADGKQGHTKGIEITVNDNGDGTLSRQQKKAIDFESSIKRRLNRDIKERQVYLHKTSVLCWIAHGNYINRVLNNLQLMEMCLKLLPSKKAYPKDKTDTKYYCMVADWFHTIFTLKSNKLYCNLKKLPTKIQSLALQIQSRQVISKCDFVLLFVIMLRSLGIQCRLVINVVPPPLRPPQKDLFVISIKSTNNTKIKSNQSPDEIKIEANSSKARKCVDKQIETTKSKDNIKIQTNKSPDKIKIEAKSSKARKCVDKQIESQENVLQSASDKNSTRKLPKNPSETKSKRTVNEKQSNIKRKAPRTDESIERHTENESSDKRTLNKPKSNLSNVKSNHVDKEDSNKLNKVPSTVCVGTPTKLRIIEQPNKQRTKLNLDKLKTAASNTFSPIKTRSRMKNATSEANTKSKLKLPQLDGAHDSIKKYKQQNLRKGQQNNKSEDSDSDFAPSPPKRIRPKNNVESNAANKNKKMNETIKTNKTTKTTKTNITNKIDNRVFSTDDDDADMETNTIRMDFWVEAYAEKEDKWIVIDPVKPKVNNIDYIRKNASKPIFYAFAWNNNNSIRDVTPRYCSQFHTSTRKLRANQLWIDDTLEAMLEEKNPRSVIEDIEFSKLTMTTPMPTSINEFKNHPLYALERHLLKFEAIYPPNALTLGYIRKEPIYARECVHTLHSREIWVKQARVVKIGEKPYKIVKARPKWNRTLNQMEEAKPLEIFGYWQTEPYKPPVAENGLVPRNAYGNVELFKPEMLPIGTRHLQLPNLNRVCKKMGVDCAQAVIGFDFHSGSSHPTFDGFVVCEEFADEVIKRWEIEQEEIIRKEKEKREARIFGNWKKLIKGLFIRERLKRKFNYGVDTNTEKNVKKHKQ